MRYLVTAHLKDEKVDELLAAIDNGSLGRGSVAGGEYIRNMKQARQMDDGSVRWVEVCYCAIPLEEETPYWEAYFDLTKIKNAHSPTKCKDLNGQEAWACSNCDCTEKLEEQMENWGQHFLSNLKK